MNDFQPNQDICLVPYYPAYEIALPWYQDAELCHQVDHQNRIYDLSILKNMYQYLDSHGDLYYIEYKGILCGDDSWGAKTHPEYLLDVSQKKEFKFSFKGI